MKNIIFCIMLSFYLFSTDYYSQIGQDKFVNDHFFKNKKNGFFLDIGAHDGISFSNTYFFEKNLEWTGICFEPVPEIYQELIKNRNCICINGAVSKVGDVFRDFLAVYGPSSMLSGFLETMSLYHKNRIDEEIKTLGGSKKILKVECFNINDFLEKNNIYHIDFLSLDTEGSEFEILKNFNFNKYKVDVIAVENNYDTKKTVKMMNQKGFNLYKVQNWDLIFINKNFSFN